MVHFGGLGRVETFGHEHAVVSPVLPQYRFFLGYDFCAGYRAVRTKNVLSIILVERGSQSRGKT
jgi:hypothetical protein